MSGGSMDYVCYKIEEQAPHLGDRELVDIAKDMAKLFHDAEWWDSGDISEKDYRETAKWFKDKWLRSEKVDERLRRYIDQISDDAKRECKLPIAGEPSRDSPAAFMISGKLFNFIWLAEAVKEKMERERND